MTRILGIDFSLTSPAYTVLTESSITCYCISNVKQPIDCWVTPQFRVIIYPIEKQFSSIYERMVYLAELPCELANDCDKVIMEDYSYGSKGLVFSIAEITGYVKYQLWRNNKPPYLIAPTAVKKWATGKGNANKELMINAFIQKTGINLIDYLPLNTQKPFTSPISDIVDSYHLACFYQYLLTSDTQGQYSCR